MSSKSNDIGVLVRGNAKFIDTDQSNDLEIGFIISKKINIFIKFK